jgi:hypothetical protein
VTTTGNGILLSSKRGDVSAATLLSETPNEWVLKVEKREVRVSKTDQRQRAFRNMSDALEWSGAEPELIAHFVALDAAKGEVSSQEQS